MMEGGQLHNRLDNDISGFCENETVIVNNNRQFKMLLFVLTIQAKFHRSSQISGNIQIIILTFSTRIPVAMLLTLFLKIVLFFFGAVA